MAVRPRVAVAHDYLTQRGGAERVVLALARAFPGAEVVTSLYDPPETFDEFRLLDVRVSRLDRVAPLRHHHRAALPLLAPAWSAMTVDADMTVCSSSGWAHGVRASGAKVVYCHAPARWLYQRAAYTADASRGGRLALAALAPPLRAWDRRAAASATRYVVNSTRTAALVRDAYGIDADVVHPPPGLTPDGPWLAIDGLEPGFVLCVARLLPYKNVDLALGVAAARPGAPLVVVGRGPDADRLKAMAPAGTVFLHDVTDAQLRWLYANASALLAVSFEDLGLTPLEAATFGTPTVALAFGGYLDTVLDGRTGALVASGSPRDLADGLDRVLALGLDRSDVAEAVAPFGEPGFAATMQEIVADVLDE